MMCRALRTRSRCRWLGQIEGRAGGVGCEGTLKTFWATVRAER